MDENQSSSRRLVAGKVIGGKYKLLEKIGSGSFGSVYKTQNLRNGEIVAAKFERIEENNHRTVSLLVREIKVLTEMKDTIGFPSLKHYGRDDSYNFFMITYLGMNLETILKKIGGKFSLDCTLKIGVQLIERLKELHTKNLIHRDMKPENFTIGKSNHQFVYLIDFGLSKYYRDSHNNHIPMIGNKGLIGTARYASINALMGNEQSRRDDLEALAYVLIYFYLGELPWQNIQTANKEDKYKLILKMKQEFDMSDTIPIQLSKFLKETKLLQFNQNPDYDNLKGILQPNKDVCDWDQLFEIKLDNEKMSVSIDLEEKEQSENNLRNSMQKIVQQDTKFISGKLQFSKNQLEVPKLSIVLANNDLGSPVGTVCSMNTSKANNYQKSQNMASARNFGSIKYQSCGNLADLDDEMEVGDDEQPHLSFQNLVVKRQYSKN